MIDLRYGVISPGVGIGDIKLGMDMRTLKKILASYRISYLKSFYIYETENIKVWVDKIHDKVTQVLVKNQFKGKFLNKFGIGSYLSEIEDFLGEKAKDELDVYVFDSVKGICFELEDIDEDWDDIEWFKKHAPIEYISVY